MTASGRSVVSRSTSTGLPRLGASSCTPPESVSISVPRRHRAAEIGVGERLGDGDVLHGRRAAAGAPRAPPGCGAPGRRMHGRGAALASLATQRRGAAHRLAPRFPPVRGDENEPPAAEEVRVAGFSTGGRGFDHVQSASMTVLPVTATCGRSTPSAEQVGPGGVRSARGAVTVSCVVSRRLTSSGNGDTGLPVRRPASEVHDRHVRRTRRAPAANAVVVSPWTTTASGSSRWMASVTPSVTAAGEVRSATPLPDHRRGRSSGTIPKTSLTWSSISRCWPVTARPDRQSPVARPCHGRAGPSCIGLRPRPEDRPELTSSR